MNHHGNTEWKVENGVLTATQDKKDNGGIVLTDKKYKNFEVYLEMNPDYGCDSGLFLRSTEKGEAYQVTLDYLPGGSYGRHLRRTPAGRKGRTMRPIGRRTGRRANGTPSARVSRAPLPHIQVWMNGAPSRIGKTRPTTCRTAPRMA